MGLPLAIELAAARVRALSPAEIVDSRHDQFRLVWVRHIEERARRLARDMRHVGFVSE